MSALDCGCQESASLDMCPQSTTVHLMEAGPYNVRLFFSATGAGTPEPQTDEHDAGSGGYPSLAVLHTGPIDTARLPAIAYPLCAVWIPEP
jgi:hypothetical protein